MGVLREDQALAARLFGSNPQGPVASSLIELPPEVADARKRIQAIVSGMEAAIAAHDFEKARDYCELERRERENLGQLCRKHHLEDRSVTDVAEDPVAAEIRRRVESRGRLREAGSLSVDLPLSDPSKRVLIFGAEEAEQLHQTVIGPEHLVLGLLREEESMAAHVLRERGVSAVSVRAKLASPASGPEQGRNYV